MLLTDFFNANYLAHRPSTSARTVTLYEYSIKKFGLHLERPATIDDLRNQTVGGYLRALTTAKLTPSTIDKERRQLLAIWRLAHTLGLIKLGPVIGPIKVPGAIPKALTLAQLKRLWATFPKLQGETGGIPNADFLRACFAIQYSTAARVGSVMQLRFDDIVGDVITFRAETRKGGRKPIVKAVPVSVIGHVNAIRMPKRELIFPVAKTNKTKIQKLYERLFARAGVPRPKGKSSHLLRSTHATLLEIAGGDATKSLGHANRETTINSYLDPRHEADRSCDLLPDLEG